MKRTVILREECIEQLAKSPRVELLVWGSNPGSPLASRKAAPKVAPFKTNELSFYPFGKSLIITFFMIDQHLESG